MRISDWSSDVCSSDLGLVVRADLPISAPTDLSGKRIAVPFGSTSYYLLLSLLRLEHIPENAVTLVDMTPSQARTAWDRREIDGAWLWETALHQMVADGEIGRASCRERVCQYV